MISTTTRADLYLRLSDFRDNGNDFAAREAKLRTKAAELGWDVGRVVVENDAVANGDGRMRPASAFKRRKIVTPSGRTELRTVRPGFRSVLDDITAGRVQALLAEDLDRTARDPRDLEDLLDAVAARGASARSLSGSLTLTAGGTDGEVTMARMLVTMANKSSRDTARRVAQSRERLAEKGTSGKGQYQGGRRPFGFTPDPDAGKYGRTLVVVEAEAAELRAAARAVLAGVSLRALARDLRDRNVPTVTGTAAWTPDTLRGCLLNHAVAGMTCHTSTEQTDDGPRKVTAEHEASWPAILDRETWQAVRDVLTDPARRTNPGSEPKWLVSGHARCHCGQTCYVRSSGTPSRPSYVCRGPQQHLRRAAGPVDEHVAGKVVEYLNREDNRDVLLRPAARPGVDVPALRAELARLAERRKALVRLNVAGDLDDADLAEGIRELKRRADKAAAQLAETTTPDPLAEFRDADARDVWESLSLARKRAVVKLLVTVELLPTRRGRGFDPESVRVRPALEKSENV